MRNPRFPPQFFQLAANDVSCCVIALSTSEVDNVTYKFCSNLTQRCREINTVPTIKHWK